MIPNGQVTIVVDDDASLRILSNIAKRCGGRVRVATVTWLELTVPEAAAPDGPPARADGRTVVWAEPRD